MNIILLLGSYNFVNKIALSSTVSKTLLNFVNVNDWNDLKLSLKFWLQTLGF